MGQLLAGHRFLALSSSCLQGANQKYLYCLRGNFSVLFSLCILSIVSFLYPFLKYVLAFLLYLSFSDVPHPMMHDTRDNLSQWPHLLGAFPPCSMFIRSYKSMPPTKPNELNYFPLNLPPADYQPAPMQQLHHGGGKLGRQGEVPRSHGGELPAPSLRRPLVPNQSFLSWSDCQHLLKQLV